MHHSSPSASYALRNQKRSKLRKILTVQTRKSIDPRRGHSPVEDYIATVVRAALKIGVGASITTSALLALQLVWIAWKTPRLPPPPLSGADFVRRGRVAKVYADESYDDADDDFDTNDPECNRSTGSKSNNRGNNVSHHVESTMNHQGTHKNRREFRLVLVGDSPVEGIGNAHHMHALGGQTARAFAKSVCSKRYDIVRYWSFGKSGLTARGIEKDMVPFLHRVVHDVHQQWAINHDDDDEGGTDNETSPEPAIHAIVVLCGVNNVLDPLSTSSSFHAEVRSLISSMRCHPGLECTPLIVLGLPDFAKLPFLPWPLSFVLGLRGRKMQRMLEIAVRESQLMERGEMHTNQMCGCRTVMVNIPEVQEVLGSIGYHRHDSSECNADGSSIVQSNINPTCSMKMRLVHPLLKYLGNSLDQSKLGSLGMEDFLCDDGFHPGRYGTVYIGNLVAEAYMKVMGNIASNGPHW